MRLMMRLLLVVCLFVPLTAQPSIPFTFTGSFRLPATVAGDTFSFGGSVLAYRPDTDTIFVAGRLVAGQQIAEVTIPANGQVATVVQSFAEPTANAWNEVYAQVQTPIYLGGLLVVGDQLCGTLYGHYDGGTGKQVTSHWCRPLSLTAAAPFHGIWRVFDPANVSLKARFFGGWLTWIPQALRASFGNRDVITGQCCITNSSSTSNGPSAWAYDSKTLAANTPARALVYYTQLHPLGTGWNTTNRFWNGTTHMAGAFWTKDALVFVGTHGTGKYCYGISTQDPTLDGKLNPNGVMYCYDPANKSGVKGGHGYPYLNQIWEYTAADLLLVSQGKKAAWSLIPTIQNFDLPNGGLVSGLTADPVHGRLFLTSGRADGDRPIVLTAQVNP